jgi:hypothetical protein
MAKNLTIWARRARIFKKILAKSVIKSLAKRFFKLKEEVVKKEEMLRLEREKEREKVELEKIKSERELVERMRMAKENKSKLKLEEQAPLPPKEEELPVDNTNVSLKGIFGESEADTTVIIDSEEKNYRRLERPIDKQPSEG